MEDFIESRPTDGQLAEVQKLAELTNWGAGKIINSKLLYQDKPPKLRVLYCLMIAVHNYSESIFVLLREGRTNAAEVLWRSLFESWVNYMYVIACTDDRHASEFMLSSDRENQKTSKLIADFCKTHPSLASEKNINLDADAIKKATADRQVELDKIASEFDPPIKNLPNLKDRMIAIDRYKKKTEAKYKPGSMEFEYLTTYRYTSDPVHLNPSGIFRMYNFQDGGIREINLSGDLTKIEGLVSLTYAIYLTFIGEFVKDFDLAPESDLDAFNRIFSGMQSNRSRPST